MRPHVPRGEWEPGGTGKLVPLLFQVAIIEALYVRAAGYSAGRNGELAALGEVEDALPLWMWAAALGVCGALCTIGMLTRTFVPQIVGHGAAAALYAGIGWGVLKDAVSEHRWEQLGAANGLIVLGLVLHGGWAITTAAKKRRLEITRELEAAERG